MWDLQPSLVSSPSWHFLSPVGGENLILSTAAAEADFSRGSIHGPEEMKQGRSEDKDKVR